VEFIVIIATMGQLRCCLLAAGVGAMMPPDARAAADTLTLDEAIGRALRVAPALEAASAQSDLSGARVNEARAPLHPSIAAGAGYIQAPGYDKVITNPGQTTSLLLDYTAYDGGRRDSRLRATRYAAEAAALGVNAARAQIVFVDTTVAYFDLTRGRAIANDVLKFRAACDAAELTLGAAHQAAAHASILRGSIVGDFGRDDLRVAEVSGLPSLPAGDLTQSPAYKAALRQVEAARLGVNAVEAEYSLTLKIALTAGWGGIDPPKTFGHYLGGSYDGAISMPLFQSGLVQSHIDEAEAVEHATRAQRRQVELELKRDLTDAGSRYQGAGPQLDLIARAQTTAKDAFALVWTRFLGDGNATLLEIIDAHQQTENPRLARSDQELGARQAGAQAQLILGLSQ
jgi:outer membrane protein TolC